MGRALVSCKGIMGLNTIFYKNILQHSVGSTGFIYKNYARVWRYHTSFEIQVIKNFTEMIPITFISHS